MNKARGAYKVNPLGYKRQKVIDKLTAEENEKFNRIEVESNVRKMAVNAVLDKKPLITDEEVVNINDKHYNIAYRDFAADIAIARAIEDKLRNKNT